MWQLAPYLEHNWEFFHCCLFVFSKLNKMNLFESFCREGGNIRDSDKSFTTETTAPPPQPRSININLEIRMEWHSITFFFYSPQWSINAFSCTGRYFFPEKAWKWTRELWNVLLSVLYQNTEKQNMFVSLCPCDGIWVTWFSLSCIC